MFSANVGATTLTVGNDTTARAIVDTYGNFVIIDTNHPVTASGGLNTFSYYASNTNAFRFVLVDSANKVLWISDQITPAGTGIQTFTPVSPVVVHAGDNLGLYFTSTGTIPFEYAGNPAQYMPNNSGLPTVGQTLAYESSNNRTYSFVATGDTTLSGTLSAEDFGVVNYDVGGGLGILKGYTAGFGVTDSTFAGATSVVVKLYAAGDVLLQTNTAILSKFNVDVTGTQFSSPFDVSGTFNYATDGYWTNVREAQYGQSVPAVKVVATVTLANSKVVTAINTSLTGDPTTIYPPVANVTTNPATLVALTSATVNGTNGTLASDNTSFWLGKTSAGPFTSATDPTGQLPAGWAGVASGAQLANASFSYAYSSLDPNTKYYFTAWSLVGGVWYPGSVLSFTTTPTTSPTPTPTITPTPTPIPPKDKDRCKEGGWESFTNPSFKNQGQCVSHFNGREDNHGEYVSSQKDKQEAAHSREGMPEQSKGHTKEK